MSLASQFMELFAGFERAHGRYEVVKKNDRGKAEGRALTIKTPVNEEIWNQHLNGTGSGLGMIPLREDNTCYWGAIDIDVIGIDLDALEKTIGKKQLPLTVCRSKSGGAHCYVFFSEPCPADILVERLSEWAALLGHGGCEVFPKQTSRVDLTQDLGNWINLPYYDMSKTMRYAIVEGQALSAEEFIKVGFERRITIDAIINLKIEYDERTEETFFEAPPCLKALAAAGGFPDGTRNNGLYNTIVYLKKRFPDDWQSKVHQYNATMADPPLTYNEVEILIKSQTKKDYDYKCKEAPIKQYCNRSACMGCKFGVGDSGSGSNSVQIGQLTKFNGEPVIWYAEVEGVRIQLSTDELLNQKLFNKKVLEKTNKLPPSLPTARWERYIRETVELATIVDTPEDASLTGQFHLIFKQFLVNQNRATSKDDLERNIVWKDTDYSAYYFKSTALLNYLRTNAFKIESVQHVWQMVRDLGGEDKQLWANHKNIRVWVIQMDGLEARKEATPAIDGGAF